MSHYANYSNLRVALELLRGALLQLGDFLVDTVDLVALGLDLQPHTHTVSHSLAGSGESFSCHLYERERGGTTYKSLSIRR